MKNSAKITLIVSVGGVILKKFYRHFLLFIVLSVGGWFLISQIETDKKEQYLKMQAKLLETKYKTNYKYFKIMSQDVYSIYADNKNISDILTKVPNASKQQRSHLRSKLYQLLQKRYVRLQGMGINQIQFILADNTSFLRMSAPQLFGDNLTDIRYTVSHTNKSKKFTEGFEIGRTVHGFRFVYPLFNAQKHYIGCIDISFSSKKMVDNILDNYINDAHFLLCKTMLEKYSWQKEQQIYFEQNWEMPEFFIEKATHTTAGDINLYREIKNFDIVQQIAQKSKSKKAFAVSSTYNYESIVLSFVPIKEVTDETVAAYIVTYIESDYLDNIHLEEFYLIILFYAILFLLFIFGIYVIINKEKLKNMAHYDTLTKLPNRLSFYIHFEHELNRAKRYKNQLGVLFIDLDGFKDINDTYGHAVGDKLLIEVANRLMLSVRGTDIVARLAGDEFTIILTDLKLSNEALGVAKKIIRELNKDFVIDNTVVNIGASIGIAIYPEHGSDMDTLVQNADTMMYEAKNNGKNIAVVYNK